MTTSPLRIIRKRLARFCALAMVGSTAAAAVAVATPSSAEAVDCGVRRLCLYSGVDWSGRVVTMSERDLRRAVRIGVDPFIKGRVSSWINTTSLTLCGIRAPAEILWTARRFSRDPYVGDEANNETDEISQGCTND